jgi:hypothetical protein
MPSLVSAALGTPNPVLAHGLGAMRNCAHCCDYASPFAMLMRPKPLPTMLFAVANASANIGAIYPLPRWCAVIASSLHLALHELLRIRCQFYEDHHYFRRCAETLL